MPCRVRRVNWTPSCPQALRSSSRTGTCWRCAKTILKPLLSERLLPQIRAAQKAGELPDAHPVLVHYMLIGMTSVLCSLRDEIRIIGGISATDPKVEHEYWALIDETVFSRRKTASRTKKHD